MAATRIAIIGASGFAREVKWLLKDLNRAGRESFDFAGYIVSDLAKVGEHDSRDEILGDYGWLEKNSGSLAAVALGIGTPVARIRIAAELGARFPKLQWPALIHPSVRMDFDSAKIGPGVVLCAGVIATVNVAIKSFAMVNLGCTIGHEAVIGAGCVLNPSVNISGGVTLGDGVLIGTGAQVLQYLNVGGGATVGAGAVVTKDVAPGEVVAGIPARPLKKS